MRAVLQRVSSASVTTDDKIIGQIKSGLMILLGIENEDTIEDIKWLCRKINSLRIFNDEDGKMNLDIQDVNGDILVISQFTLHAKYKKGNRPSYIKAAKPDISIPLYEAFIAEMKTELGKEIQTGKFGAMMDVELINSGPVTIILDTKNKE